MPDLRRFEPADLDGVLALCESEGWMTFPNDRERARRVLTAPGVTTIVAVEAGTVVGFAELLSDGELQSYLANLLIAPAHRRTGLGRALIEEVSRVGGGERIDLLSEDAAVPFYESIPHKSRPGFRIYPFEASVVDERATQLSLSSRSALAQRFRTVVLPLSRRGYQVDSVDTWLEAAAVAIAAAPGSSSASFDRPTFSTSLRGYDRSAVDALVDEVVAALGGTPAPQYGRRPS